MRLLQPGKVTTSEPAPPGKGWFRLISLPSIEDRIWRVFLYLGIGLLLFFIFWQLPAAAKQTNNPTSTPNADGAYITVTYIEPINVRAGPGSYDYPIIGTLPVGATAPALGRSPAGEWIQIGFPAGPKGVGWVYAWNVALTSPGMLPVVIPPPTLTPATTDTINPTYAAALQAIPTSTRKPTFTAPPPLQYPTYASSGSAASGGFQTGWIIVGLGAIGLVGMAVSSLRRR